MANAVTEKVSKLIPGRRPSRTFEEPPLQPQELHPVQKENYTPGTTEWFEHGERLVQLMEDQKQRAEQQDSSHGKPGRSSIKDAFP